jgi:hypothetical protein
LVKLNPVVGTEELDLVSVVALELEQPLLVAAPC